MKKKFSEIVEDILERDIRYKRDAYEFIMEALTYTQKKYKQMKHVTGKELLEGTKELLMDKYGPMTLTVLRHWGIHGTEDFGNIVFNLVDSKVLSKTDDDKLEHFLNGFDFQEVFEKRYKRKLARKISRMR